MTAFEQLLALADEDTLEIALNMTGREKLALLLAKTALTATTESLSPTAVAETLKISRTTASDWVHNTQIKRTTNGGTL